MKISIKSLPAGLLAGLAFVTLCATARADLAITNSTTISSWNQVGGLNPFYVSLTTSGLTGLSAQGQPSAGTGATFTVLSETFTITNGAGSLANPNSNYLLTGLAIVGGNEPANSSLHLYDITTNLISNNGSTLNGSGATYNFVANGDLLGNGHGLAFSNTLAGTDQVLFNLSAGPNTQDQVVLGKNHTYALEFWTPASGFSWDRASAADAGGQAMGSHDASLGVARTTISSLGLAGGAPRTFSLALYGSATSAAFSVNNSTNSTVSAPTTNYVVNEFNSEFEVTNVQSSYDSSNGWANWFGDAFVSATWDPTSDVSNNPASGSMKIVASFSESTDQHGQYVVFDGFGAINGVGSPQYTNLQFSIRYDASSLVRTNANGSLDFGSLQVGTSTPAYGQDFFGSVAVPVTNSLGQPNTNWITVNIPLNAVVDPVQTNIVDVMFHNVNYYYGDLEGTMTYWVDNIRFVGPGATVTVVPPTLAIAPAIPGLRFFAGSTVNTYDRAELASVDQNLSWIGGAGYPASYSFTLLDYPANIGQTHIQLVPVNTAGQSNMGNTGSPNEYIDYQASNELWLVIAPAGTGVTATVQWKTNSPNANPNQTALTITNTTAVGTWTLKFTGPSTGTLTAPGASPKSFTIADPTVATDFANPLVAYFGVQPNSTAGEGQYEDWAFIGVTNVLDGNISDNFAADTTPTSSGNWNVNTLTTALATTSLQVVPSSSLPAYWVNWTLPAFGYALGTSDNILGSTVAPAPWMLPEYYDNYGGTGNGTILPGIASQGLKGWVLIPSTCLPTVDGQPQSGQALSTNAFFELVNPSLSQ